MAFSPESLLRLLSRRGQKLRIRRRLLAAQASGLASRFPEPSCKELYELCLETRGLERGLVGFLEQRIPSRPARARLRTRWRRVHQANAIQLDFAEAWQRGGVVDASRMQQVAEAIRAERGELRLFVRDLVPRIRPRLAVVRHGGFRQLAGAAIRVRVDPASHRSLQLGYRPVARFDSWHRALAYRGLYRRYRQALEEECGLRLPWGAARIVGGPGRGYRVYVTSELVPRDWVASEALQALPEHGALALARLLVGELARVWRRPSTHGGMQVAVSGRLDCWAIADFDPEGPEIRGDERLIYLGAHLPLLRQRGRPLLDPQVLIQGIPWPVAAPVESLVQAALSRPHQPRNVLIDALASFEARPSLGAPLLELANELVEDELGRWIDRTLGLDEVRERERRDDRLTRLLRSLDRVGGVFRAWRHGRPPQLVDAAFDLYAILTRPRRADPEP